MTGADSTPITDDHSVATVHWRRAYRTKAGREVTIDFDVHYFIKSEADKGGNKDLKILGSMPVMSTALKKAGVI
ncbi:MAG: hypothetical protein AB7E79_09395 [Rhodospirillaceae bacterium]